MPSRRTGASTRSQRVNQSRSDSEQTFEGDSAPLSPPLNPLNSFQNHNALLIAVQIKSLEEEDTRKAEAYRL